MANPTEAQLLSALQTRLMTAEETINTAVYTGQGSPTFAAAATSFPNGRTIKFVDLNGSTQYYTANLASACDLSDGILHLWMKPGFSQTYGTSMVLFSNYDATPNDGFLPNFDKDQDDWTVPFYIDGSAAGGTLLTTGETWSSGDVLHYVLMWHKGAGLDDSKSRSLYINNVLKATTTTTWADTGDDFATSCKLGANHVGGQNFLGGMVDFAIYDYAALAAIGTDAEIVSTLYSNTLKEGSHLFSFEVGSTRSTFTPKVMIF